MKNNYEILGLERDATKDDIITAFATAKVNLNLQRGNGSIDAATYNAKLQELGVAYEVLIDDDMRADYDALLTGTARPKKNGQATNPNQTDPYANTGATVGSGKKRSGILKKVATGAVIAVLAISLIAGAKYAIDRVGLPFGTSYSANTPVIVIESGYDNQYSPGATATPDVTQTPDVSLGSVPGMVNYGDASNDSVVTEKATNLLQDVNAAGLYNMGTNSAYTTNELKVLIQYMNGAYKPKNEQEAYTLVNEYLNFALAPLNSEHVLFAVQYQGGEDSLKGTLQGYIDDFHRVNIVDNMLLGNSSAYPYLKWFENQYNAMLCTTDREECNRIYESMIQSLADMIYGDGFTLDGKTYSKSDFLGLDRVNSGNVLNLLVYMMEPFRTGRTKDTYIVTNKLLSADPEEQRVPVTYLQITEQFNALCADDLSAIALDDEGLLLIDQTDGKNFAYINQVNTINRALMVYYGNANAYTNVYQKGLNN